MNDHIVRAYDEEIRNLRLIVSKMGGIAEGQVANAQKALFELDSAAAQRSISEDKLLDALEKEAERTSVIIFARRAPVADDLREIMATLKITSLLERIGDYASNIAGRGECLIALNKTEPPACLADMATMAQDMVTDIMNAYAKRDTELAMDVWLRDETLDSLYNATYQQILTNMTTEPTSIEAQAHLLMAAKNLERIGDKCTNISEQIYFSIRGTDIPDERPKADTTATIQAGPIS